MYATYNRIEILFYVAKFLVRCRLFKAFPIVLERLQNVFILLWPEFARVQNVYKNIVSQLYAVVANPWYQ
jgi:hypothetical protein